MIEPKVESEHARDAYSQLMALCCDLNISHEVIEQAIIRVEYSAKAYKESSVLRKYKSCRNTGLELEAVAKYYRDIYNNIKDVRTNICKGG